jgi:hypothetical protein
MNAPLPGWYRDPSGEPGLRYWDGTSWTDQRKPSLVPPSPHEPVPKRRSLHPAFVFLAVISLLVTALPAIGMFNGHDSVNPFTVLWLLWHRLAKVHSWHSPLPSRYSGVA